MKHDLTKMCVGNNPHNNELIQSEKRVPITLLPKDNEVVKRLLSDPKLTRLALRHQFAPETLNLNYVTPLVRLYVNYPDMAKQLFSDYAIQMVKGVLGEYPLLLKDVARRNHREEASVRSPKLLMPGILANLYHDDHMVTKVFRRDTAIGSGDNWHTELTMNRHIMASEPSPYLLMCSQAVEEDKVMVFPYCHHGDIISYMQCGRASWKLKKKWMHQMVDAVFHLHEVLGMAHMDLSLENFMVTKDVDLKLGDFAQAYRTHTPLLVRNVVGKKCYSARELVEHTIVEDTKACDMWSLGICIFSMFFNCFLWTSCKDRHFLWFVKDPEGFWAFYGQYIKDTKRTRFIISLVKKLLYLDPAKRLSIVGLQNELK